MELLKRILWLLPLISPIATTRIKDEISHQEGFTDPFLQVAEHPQHEEHRHLIKKREVQTLNPSSQTDRNERKQENNGDENIHSSSTIKFSSREELQDYLQYQSGQSSNEKSTQRDRLRSNKNYSTNEDVEAHEELKTKSLYKHKADESKHNPSGIEERESYRVSTSEDFTSGNLPHLSENPIAGKITSIRVSVEYSNSSEAPSLELIRDDSGLFFISGEDINEGKKGIDLDDYIDIDTHEGYPEYGAHRLNITEPLFGHKNPSIYNSNEAIGTMIDFSSSKTKKSSNSKSKLKLLMDKPKRIMPIIKSFGNDRWLPEPVPGILVPTDDGKQQVFVSDSILGGSAYLLETLQPQMQDDFVYESSTEEKYLTSESRIIETSPVPMKGMPYEFGWIVDDEATANFQTRQEQGYNTGVVTGCYQVLEPTGLVRTVQYIADDGGFRILSLTNGPDKTPCPGLEEAGRLSQASATQGKTFNRPIQTLPPPTAPPPPPSPRPTPQPFTNQPLLNANYNLQQSFSSSSSNYSASNSSNSNTFNYVSNGYNPPRPTTLPPRPPPPTTTYRPPPPPPITATYRPRPPITNTYRPPPTPAPTYAPTTSYRPPPPPSTISYPSSTYRPTPSPRPLPPRPNTAYTIPPPPPPPSYTRPPPPPTSPSTRPPPPVRVPITTSPPVSSVASLTEYNFDESAKQAWMTEYLENLSQQIYGSYSNSSTDTSYFGTPNNKINFPFVLIPITTFLELQSKGALEGNIQTFGAYVAPPINKPKQLKPVEPTLSYLPPVSGGKAVHKTTTNVYNTTETKAQQVKHRQEGITSINYQVKGVQGQAPQVTQQVANQYKSQESSEESKESSSSSSSHSATNVQYNAYGGQQLSQQQQNHKQSKAISSNSNSKSSSFNSLGNIQSGYLPPYQSKPSITFPTSPPVSLTYGTPWAAPISTPSPTVTSQATKGAFQQSYQSQQFVKSSANEENSSSGSSKEINYSNDGNQQHISQQYSNQQSSESNSKESSSSSLIQSNFGNIQSPYLLPNPSTNIESAYLPPKPSITLDSAYLPPYQQAPSVTSPQPATAPPSPAVGSISLELPSAHYSAPGSSVSYSQQSSNSNENEESSSSASQVYSNIAGNSKSYSAESTSSDNSKFGESSKSSSQYSLNNSNTKIHKASSSSSSASKSESQKSYNFNSGAVQEYLPPIVSSSPPTYTSLPPTPAPYVNPSLSYLPPVNSNTASSPSAPKTPAPYANPSLSYLPPVNSNSPAVPIAQFSYQLPLEGSDGKAIKNYELVTPTAKAEPTYSDTEWKPYSPNYAIFATPTPHTINNYSLQSSSAESSNEESRSQQSQQYVGSLQSAIPASTSQSGGNPNGYNYSSRSSQSSSSSGSSQENSSQQYSGIWSGSNSPPQFVQFPSIAAFAPPKTPQIPGVDQAQLEVRTWNSQNHGR